ncbi:13800_t:CDS:2, partial [Gigaspora margarita]
VEMEEIDNIDSTKKIKISKPKYTTDNFVLKPLVKWGRMGQTSNDKKAPKAPRMKLRGFILNAQSKDFREFKIFKPPGPFIITLIFLASKDSEFWNKNDLKRTYDFFKPGVTRFDNVNQDIT